MKVIKLDTMSIYKPNKKIFVIVESNYNHFKIYGAFYNKMIPTIRVRKIGKRTIKIWLKNKSTRLVDVISRRSIYMMVDSTDCDHCRSVSAHKLDNYKEADRFIDMTYDNAEGRTGVWRISKEEYENHKPYHRDYIMEAFEDGHPYSVEG